MFHSFFFLFSTCVPPEIASERHIGVNIRRAFPMQPVNADKRQRCVILCEHILKDYASLSRLVCVRSSSLVYVRSAPNSRVCVAYLVLRSSEHDDFSFKFCPHSVPSSYLFAGARWHFSPPTLFFFFFLSLLPSCSFFSFRFVLSAKVRLSRIIWAWTYQCVCL